MCEEQARQKIPPHFLQCYRGGHGRQHARTRKMRARVNTYMASVDEGEGLTAEEGVAVGSIGVLLPEIAG